MRKLITLLFLILTIFTFGCSKEESPTISDSQNYDFVVTEIGYVNVETGSTLNLRSEPNTEADIITQLEKNEEVTIVKNSSYPGWLQIITTSGDEGFVAEQYISSDINLEDINTPDNVFTSSDGINVVASADWDYYDMADMSLALAKNNKEELLFMIYHSELGEPYFYDMIDFLHTAHADYITNTASTEEWISYYLEEYPYRDENTLWIMSEYWKRDYITYKELEELFCYSQAMKMTIDPDTPQFETTDIQEITVCGKSTYIFIGQRYYSAPNDDYMTMTKTCIIDNGKAYIISYMGFSDVFNLEEAIMMTENVFVESLNKTPYSLDEKVYL